ncbi:MAG: SUMF1/EgtB/PvdO family nonheme iron enzyme [Planctomycetes bacterium]|nr:SUMF1/EgtB/PvdO family nonheme iron enzyme [Planctomycetota bacterium]
MVHSLPGAGDASPAEIAFLEYVHLEERGLAPDFDAFCAERPEIREDLESLRDAWRLVSRVLESGRGGFSLARAAGRGSGAASSRDAPAGVEAPVAELLRKLETNSPREPRYQVVERLARGGMGVILKAWDESLRRNLAMKVILGRGEAEPPGGTRQVDPRLLSRFLEEAQLTGQLEHPGIVPVHELGIDQNGSAYFTMRLVKGRDLREIFELVKEGAEGWSVTRALAVILQVCDAMAFAHDKHVIHRDLKPSNIMVGRFGETYVMDWGLARVLGRRETKDIRIRPRGHAEPGASAVFTERDGPDSPLLTMDGDVVGTPAYMAPEQARGRVDEVGPTADVYSVGAILYQLLAGRAPYLDAARPVAPQVVLERVAAGPPRPVHAQNPEVPAELEAICDKAMARDLGERYAGMEELAADLRAYLERRVVAAYESGPLAELKKWVIRNKAVAATVAAAILVIAALSSWAFQRIALERNAALTEKARVMRLSATETLSRLKESMAALWPAVPAQVAAMEDWLEGARALLADLPWHEETLSQLRARGTPARHALEGDLERLRARQAELEGALARAQETASAASIEKELGDLRARIPLLKAAIERERPFDFADQDDGWWHRTLVALVSDLVALSADDPHGETVSSMEARLEFARGVRHRTLEEPRAEWESAIAAIADRDRCPRYAGLKIVPQLGLIPIGPDVDSGLWEFHHVQSGARPERDANGRLLITPESGLVLVLIPGGTFCMGAQKRDEALPNFDPAAQEDEEYAASEVLELTLAPFFLAKHEMTQAQWERFCGANPSWFAASFPEYTRPTCPVEQVHWEECDVLTRRLGLLLPTEAQWEYACRAGTTTPWSSGAERESLAGAANTRDRRFGAIFNYARPGDWEDRDDGWGPPAPVGSKEASAFGLHDMHGNVYEWCLDGYRGYVNPARAGDGARESEPGTLRVARGGSYDSWAPEARSAARHRATPLNRSARCGLRPARSLDP